MGVVHVKEMTGGLDARRLPETTPGGVLIKADNGHITRGGEFHSRAAFVPVTSLPDGTIGLAQNRTGLVTFGSAATPSGMPSNVQYQRLQKSALNLVRIRDWELFEDKIYVIAEFDDGSVVHFYNGTEDTDWTEARARVKLKVDSGSVTAALKATAQVSITGGTGEVINTITSLTVAGTELLSEPVIHTGDNATTAAAVAAEINANPTSPRYNAAAAGGVITLTADRAGVAANGRTIDWTVTGNFTLDDETAFAGGADEVTPVISSITIGGVSISHRPVLWAGSPAETAQAIASAIMDTASAPEYEASAYGDTVVVRAAEEGTALNGKTIACTTAGTIVLSNPGCTATAGGAALTAGKYLPADSILTVKEKMYAGAGSILHYSAIQGPDHWVPGGTAAGEIGAGFSNVAASNSSSYRITGMARYHDKLAVFTPDTVQTWFLDPDPDLFLQTQVLENTGTECPRSVTQFGDADIFYLDMSGLRSLRARDSSNAAATTDIGVPIDDLLAERLVSMSYDDKQRVIGLINPIDKRFWLILGSEIFVYSYYPSSKVNAWSRYTAECTTGDETVAFDISDAVVFGRRVFLRAGAQVYCYGGMGAATQYDDTPAEAWLPLLDANAPAAQKQWTGVDVALTGVWELSVSYDPLRPDAADKVANIDATTFGQRSVPMKNSSTHAGLRFKSRGGKAVLSSMVLHFDGKVNED